MVRSKNQRCFAPHQKTFAYGRSNGRSYPYSIPLGLFPLSLEAIKRQSFFLCHCQSFFAYLSQWHPHQHVYLSEFLPLIPSHTFFRSLSIFYSMLQYASSASFSLYFSLFIFYYISLFFLTSTCRALFSIFYGVSLETKIRELHIFGSASSNSR